MNITVRFSDESVTKLLQKLATVDAEVIEVFDEQSRQRPYTGIRNSGDVAKDTAAQARAAVQNG